ncbi:MAG: PA14 domain-containing protein, partial [Planctomycetota bacterium]
MCRKLNLFILVLCVVVGVSSVASAQIITAVAQRNPDAPEPPEIAEPLVEEAEAFVDRTHQYEQIPASLIGLQYVKTANDNKGAGNYELDVTISQLATVYLFLDNRMGGAGGGELTNPNLVAAGMTWVTTLGFTDTGDNIAFDESADGDIDQWSSVFSAVFPAGTITFLQQDDGGGRNMYGVAAAPPPMTARNPNPEDGSTIDGLPYPPDYIYVVLTFDAGFDAQSHEVFFSDDEAKVTNRDPCVSLGAAPDPMNPTEYYAGVPLPAWTPYNDSLVRGTWYYWCADETDSNGVPWEGPTWSFYVALDEASSPRPADGGRFVSLTPILRWAAGAISGVSPHTHQIYLGTSRVDVNNAVEGGPLHRAGNAWDDLDWEPNSEGGLTLTYDTDYYWRVDEKHGTFGPVVLKGPVWTFKTIPLIPITDPNLIGSWKLDEGEGDLALDWSGHGNHGTLSGNPPWVSGMIGNALEFNGSNQYVGIMGFDGPNDINEVTYCMWVKADVVTGNHKMWFTNESSGYGRVRCRVINGNWALQHGQGVSGNNVQVTSPAIAGVWTHFAGVRVNNNRLELFIDGESMATVPFLVPGRQANPSSIGGEWRGGTDLRHMFDGIIDDVRVYDYALTASEIIRAAAPLEAWAPSPVDGPDVKPEDFSLLSWRKGAYADKHTVYFGPSISDVNGSATAVSVKQNEPNYDPGPLAYDTYYYWRIDEVNEVGPTTGVWTGNIWSFYLMRPNRGVVGRYYHWIDPTVVAGGDPGPDDPFQTFVLERIDPDIDFEWGNGTPDPLVNVDDFSVQWVGEVEAEFTETYTFTVRTDDGARLWVNDQLLVDSWINQGPTRYSGTIDLVAGDAYPLVVEWYERGGGAVVQLFWESPSLPEEIVPQRLLSLALRATNPRPRHRQEISAEEVTLLS